MARFVSSRNPVSTKTLKRKPIGTLVIRRSIWENVNFTRVNGGWVRQRMDVTSERSELVSSADVANECNSAIGCKESWAKVY